MSLATPMAPSRSHGRLSDTVYETLLDAIVSGRLARGAIVSEVALAKQYEVSRTPVHDALRQLAKDGLVQQRANHRAVIATLTREDVTDIFEMRKVLEGEAAYRAALVIDRATLIHLRDVANNLSRTRHLPDWLSRWADFDEEFHSAIAKASGSRRLYEDIRRYRMLHRGLNMTITTVDCLQKALQEHCGILDALERRDAERARAEMVAHIKEWQAYFCQHMPR